MNDSKALLSNLDAEKNFIANASHELRSPIAIIRGFAELLQEQPKMNHEMVKDVSEKILRSSLRLEKLVKSLLMLSDIDNIQSTAWKKIEVLPLIQHSKDMVVASHPEAQISIQCKESEICVAGEADLLEMAVINLLENAIKYSPVPALIEVTISSVPTGVMIAFQDRGIGIEAEHLPHIFDRFYSANKARARKFGGAGLGLSLVKTIVDKHRGSISVTSECGTGSVFSLLLPFVGSFLID